MNFFEYLKLDEENVKNDQKVKRVKINENENIEYNTINNIVEKDMPITKSSIKKNFQEAPVDFKECIFRKGDFIKVIRQKRSDSDKLCGYDSFGARVRTCDIYSGYYGEIVEYFRGNDNAVIHLNAPNISPRVSIPIKFITKVT